MRHSALFYLVTFFLSGISFFSVAQKGYEQRLMSIEDTYNPSFKWGIVGGVNPIGEIRALQTTIISETYFIGTYEMKQKPLLGMQAGFFTHYKIPGIMLGWYNEVSYSQQGTDLHFENNDHFIYDMRFKYQYINIVELLRVYPFMPRITNEGKPFQGLYLGAGGQLGFNIAPENITYQSGGPGYKDDFGPDLQQQQQLRNVLKGKTDFGLTTELGYVIPKYRLDIGVRAHLGLTDLVETQPNSYNFIENKNTGIFLQCVVRLDLSGLGNNIH